MNANNKKEKESQLKHSTCIIRCQMILKKGGLDEKNRQKE